MPNGSPKTSDTASFTVLQPEPTAAGVTSTGGWANNLTAPPYWNFPNEVLEGIAAPIRPSLPVATNPTITKVSPNSYSVTLSLSGTNTVQLAPSFVNSQSQDVAAVSPNVFSFVYQTRQRLVATCDANGLVTATGRGQCSILIGSARTANLPFANAEPPAGLIGCEAYCELLVTVVA